MATKTATTVCVENRNGFLFAYDAATAAFVAPGGLDFKAGEYDHQETTPEDLRAELERRGVAEVLVYTGPNASWLNGQVLGYPDRLRKFGQVASQAKPGKVWAVVPVARLTDGTDWSDVYMSR